MAAAVGKKRRATGPALDADASLYASFSGAATAVATLYAHAAAQSRRSHAAGARDFAERMLAWARAREAAGHVTLSTAELVLLLESEAAVLDDAEAAAAAETAAAAPQPPPQAGLAGAPAAQAAQGLYAARVHTAAGAHAHAHASPLSPAKQRAAAAAAAAAAGGGGDAWRMQARLLVASLARR